MRIGFGYDIHRLATGRKLILGSVAVNYKEGLAGHSDGDVLVHAVIDALLGAAGLGDIGEQFPDTAEEYRNIASMVLLERVIEMVAKSGFKVINVDTTIVAEAPKLGPHKKEMSVNMSKALGIDSTSFGVKAKTNEGIGEVGQGNAISAYAVALLEEK